MGVQAGMLLFFFLAAMAAAAKAGNLQVYVVHMNPSKVQVPGSVDIKAWYSSLVREAVSEEKAATDEPEPEILYAYETLITGFAAKLSPEHVSALQEADDLVIGVYPDGLSKPHTTFSPKFLGLVAGSGLWVESDYAKDVIIGMVDTGIWPEHPSFAEYKNITAVPAKWKGVCEKGTGFNGTNCSKKLVGARYYYKGYEAGNGAIEESMEYKSPRDSLGHGTHTASTAAGNAVGNASLFGFGRGSATGMAPSARLAVYKVCWLQGCANSDILAAMDQAVADGVDVLSISLGGASIPFYNNSIAVAAFSAVEKGVFVSCSAGNSGPSTQTVTNEAPWLMTVGASSTSRGLSASINLHTSKTSKKFKAQYFNSGKLLKPRLGLVYNKTAGNVGANFCAAGTLRRSLVRGKIVVCDQQQFLSSPQEQGEEVATAGGAAMILTDTEVLDPFMLPTAILDLNSRAAIRSYIKSAKNPTATIVYQGSLYTEKAPVLASFSSRGPGSTNPYILKPDVIAPGLNILAAWPSNLPPSELVSDKRTTIFNILSGTSMSCPHVSGIAALIKAAHPEWSPSAIKSALMTTAYVTDNKDRPITDRATGAAAAPFDIGSGHINPPKAVDPGMVYEIKIADYVQYFCSINYTSAQIRLLTGKPYDCPAKQVLKPGDLNYPSFTVLNEGKANSTVSYTRTVTNVGPAKSTYSVKVVEPKGVKVIVKSNVLKFTEKNQRLSYNVSFSFVDLKVEDHGSITWSSALHTVTSPVVVLGNSNMPR